MDFYHGSVVSGLTELKPFGGTGNNIKEPLVYLTTDRHLALHYIMDKKSRFGSSPMLNIRDDGVLVFQEMFSGALEYVYKGLSGYIYRCVGDYKLNPSAGVATAATSDTPVPIADCEFIPDVYASILSYAEEGKFIRERYEDLPNYRRDIIRGYVYRWVAGNKVYVTDPNDEGYRFYSTYYAEFWREAKVLHENGLLKPT
jgi:hypothetical protein